MGNMLTHGLLAGAIMVIVNVIVGLEPVSWDVFLAAAVSIVLNLDSGDGRTAPGSPACHSLGFGLFMVYLVGVFAYISISFTQLGTSVLFILVLGFTAGVLAHLLAEAATGEQVFTFPDNLKPETWLVCCDSSSGRFWPAWGRFSLKRWRMGDSHLNAISLSVIFVSIWIFQQPF